MGLRETYPGRAPADLAHGALKGTHAEHPAALEGRSGGGPLGERGGGVAPKGRARQLLCTCTAVPGTP
jgi:hypothetical protein